jgi:hypothetical protein
LNVRRLVLAVCVVATTAAWAGAQGKQSPSPEQTHFSAEDDGVAHPVTLPDDVLKALEKDERVRTSMESSDPPVQTPPSSWFSASKVHLASQEEDDLVVLAEGELRGANVIMFWVFRKTGQGFELVLEAPAHDLEIRKRRSNGYRDIEIVAMTASEVHTVLYRFDGKRYVVRREKLEPIK